jgi:hypothetical protein
MPTRSLNPDFESVDPLMLDPLLSARMGCAELTTIDEPDQKRAKVVAAIGECLNGDYSSIEDVKPTRLIDYVALLKVLDPVEIKVLMALMFIKNRRVKNLDPTNVRKLIHESIIYFFLTNKGRLFTRQELALALSVDKTVSSNRLDSNRTILEIIGVQSFTIGDIPLAMRKDSWKGLPDRTAVHGFLHPWQVSKVETSLAARQAYDRWSASGGGNHSGEYERTLLTLAGDRDSWLPEGEEVEREFNFHNLLKFFEVNKGKFYSTNDILTFFGIKASKLKKFFSELGKKSELFSLGMVEIKGNKLVDALRSDHNKKTYHYATALYGIPLDSQIPIIAEAHAA